MFSLLQAEIFFVNPRANQWHWLCQPIWENEIKKAARFRTLLGKAIRQGLAGKGQE